MAKATEHAPPVTGPSPLARFIRQQREEHGWTYDDLSHNARTAQVKASPEVFRKAANDDHVQPLKQATVQQLAAGLKTTEQRIRDLDAQRWGASAAPVASGLDPQLAAALTDLSPSEVQRVIDFARGIQAGR